MDKKEHCSLCDKLFEDIDKERVRRSVSLLREEHPDFTRQALCRLVIEREATFCGIVGGFTGALPWPWLILGVAPDMITLLVKQSQMILSIAYIYGCDPDSRERILEILGCLGASAGAVAGTYGIRKLVERSAAKAVTDMLLKRILRSMVTRISPRIVPIIGATAGIAFNQASVWSVGKIAMEYYKYYKMPSHLRPAPPGSEEPGEDESSEEDMESRDREPEEEETEDREREPDEEEMEDRERELEEEEMEDRDREPDEKEQDAGGAAPDEEEQETKDDENGEHGSLDNVLTDEEVRELLDGRKTGAEEPQINDTEDAAEGEKASAETDSDDREKDPQNISDDNTKKKKITRITLNSDEEPGKSDDEKKNN
ncbi:MAG: EcsC family protein [Vulcanimicrobiota bacterium]